LLAARDVEGGRAACVRGGGGGAVVVSLARVAVRGTAATSRRVEKALIHAGRMDFHG
jgi:hypothetical protein|tara:strand:- start:509 stop:679 length:171 start_codon:yes stop_codon:yes gene_type:complete